MADLSETIDRLKEERDQLQGQLGRLDEAIAALGKIAGTSTKPARKAAKRKRLSAAARERIAAAQRARWAKHRQQKKAAAKKSAAA